MRPKTYHDKKTLGNAGLKTETLHYNRDFSVRKSTPPADVVRSPAASYVKKKKNNISRDMDNNNSTSCL